MQVLCTHARKQRRNLLPSLLRQGKETSLFRGRCPPGVLLKRARGNQDTLAPWGSADDSLCRQRCGLVFRLLQRGWCCHWRSTLKRAPKLLLALSQLQRRAKRRRPNTSKEVSSGHIWHAQVPEAQEHKDCPRLLKEVAT